MEKKLQPLKNKLLLFFFFIFSVGIFGQTLVTYNFNNNLGATTPNAGIVPYSLDYYDPVNPISPAYYNNALRFVEGGDEVRFQFNGTNFSGLNVSFNGWAGAFGFGGITVNIKAYLKVGAGAETLIGNQDITANFIAYNEEPFSINIPSADNQANIQIRIVGTIVDNFGFALKGFGIDQLVLSSRSPKIQPYGYNPSNFLATIPETAEAATRYGTDFGIISTDDAANPNAANRVFRITNNGTAPLEVSGISFSGSNPGDFTWVTSPTTPAPTTPAATNPINSFPATITAGSFRDFTVRFNPSADGKRSALLNIASNANPSPYSFYVEGRGSTCATTNLAIKSNTIEDSQPSSDLLTATVVSGSFSKVFGNSRANAANPNNLSTGNGTRLYCQVNTNRPLFTSSNTSWYTRNTTNTVAFGPVDIANENGVYISFNLAAFSTATRTDFGNADYVELQVLKPGTSGSTDSDWSSELRVEGNDDFSNENTRYSFDVGITAETTYDGDGTYSDFQNGETPAAKYSKIKLNIPGTSGIDNLIFRIVAYNTSLEKLWLIDDVAVSSANVIERRWNGTAWTDGNDNSVAAPDEATKSYKNYRTVFNGDYTVPATNLSICECEVSSAANLTVPANSYLSVQTKVINKGDGNNVVVASDGNLIQIEDEAVNSGSITAERLVSDINNISTHMDYLYWSAPVTGQGLKAFSPGTPDNRIFQYNEPNDLFKAVPLATEPNFVPGKGYAFRAESGTGISNPYSKTYKFKGVPNNGLIEREVQRSPNTGVAADVVHGYNLIGNPYPSNMSFEQFYQLNKDVIYNTAWFWTNNFFTPNQQGSGYGQNNYAVWNGTGGVAATTTAPADSNPSNPASNTTTPNGIVTVGQGFIVQVKNLGLGQKVQFRNRNGNTPLRVNNAGTFFSRQNEEKDRFWLKLISADSIVNSQLIGYIDGATNGYEQDYDAELMGMSSDVFYSLLEDRRLQIQGKGAFDPSDKVQLGANIFKNGTYTIAIENPEGIFNAGQKVYLKDNLLNRWVDLTAQTYTFEATKGITEGRFEIVYESPTVLATDAVTKDEVMVYRDSGDFVVKAKSKKITMLEVYDGSGRLVYTAKPNDTRVVISGDRLNRGVYILKISQDGVVTAKKILK